MTEDALESTETNEPPIGNVETAETTEEAPEAEQEAFTADYVKGLRKQSAGYRDRANVAEASVSELTNRLDELAKQLFDARVAATGRLADSSDLQFNAELDTPDAINAAIDALLEAKPHLAARKPTGDIGQGQRGTAAQPFNLLQELKTRI